MFRNGNYPKHKENVNFLFQNVGMGDIVCAFVALDYIYKTYPWVSPIIWAPDYAVEFAKHVLPKGAIVKPFSKGEKEYNSKLGARTNEWKHHTAMRTHPVDHAFHTFVDKTVDITDKNYLKVRPEEIDLSKFSLPAKYVVIPVGHTAKPKELPVAVINQIALYSRLKGYTPVFLGKTDSKTGYKDQALGAEIGDVDYSHGVNLVNKTTLLESAGVIAGAKAFIGIDGGLLHVAGFTDTHIIAAYTFVNPNIFAPYRNNSRDYKIDIITPPESLGCRFCQSNLSFIYGDFRSCYYGDSACARDLTFNQYKPFIDKILT